jgi:hypothetical protein
MPAKQRQAKSRKNQRTPRAAKPIAITATITGTESAGGAAIASSEVATIPAATESRPRPTRAGRAAPVARAPAAAAVLTREQEYGFIRSDLRRLLVTSGALTVVMLLLLFLIDR